MNGKLQRIGQAIGVHLGSTEVRIWHMVVGFLLTIAITTGVNYWLTLDGRHDNLLGTRSQDLVTASAEFENRVHEYLASGHALDNLDQSKFAELAKNIDSQIAALNKLRPVLVGPSLKIADDYQSTLVDLRDAIEGGDITVENTKRFGEDAILVTQKRDQLLRSL